MSRQLLVDTINFQMTPQQVNESLARNNGKLVVHGILQRADAKNHNGRVYPKPILMRESKKYASTYVAEQRALGELDHPDSSVVNLKNVSHNITDLWWKGSDLMGKIEILTTPSGNILSELLKNGIRLGISSRGLGSVKPISEDGVVEVQDDFEILCWDFVSNPSTQGAFMKPLHESAGQDLDPKIKRELNLYFEINSLINDILSGE